jgi:hypothetical protein
VASQVLSAGEADAARSSRNQRNAILRERFHGQFLLDLGFVPAPILL